MRDGSLGEGPLDIAPGLDPLGQPADYLIGPELGEQVGGNLFHSFSDFGIGTGETATFTGPDPIGAPQGVDNIISRVTGGNPSAIDGTLRSTVAGADVYLLNPAGLLFGENAQLDVQGSFHATTADRLEFAGGQVFEALAGGPAPLLAVAAPEAFGFLSTNQAPIQVEGELLVGGGASLSLIGAADVTLEASGRLRADSEGAAGAVGAVVIEGGVVTLRGAVSADGQGQGNGGRVSITGTESVTTEGFVSASGGLFLGDGGEVSIEGGAVRLLGGIFVEGRGTGNGRSDGGSISVAGMPITLVGGVSANASGSGTRGTITFYGDVDILNQGLVVRDGSLGSSPAGSVAGGLDPLGQPAYYLIGPELGEQVGGNLFHSFSDFGIGTGETAIFTGPDPIDAPQSVDNIISRVTGGNPSAIDGTLRSTVPGADVYLLNPAGLLFGENAQLDVQGSFYATTADQLEFSDGQVLEARIRGQVPLLVVAAVEDFGFLPSNEAPIRVAGELAVKYGGSLTLVGAGKVTLDRSGVLTAGTTSGDAGVVTVVGNSVTLDGRVSANAERGNGGTIVIKADRVDGKGHIHADGSGAGGAVSIEGRIVDFLATSIHVSSWNGGAGRVSVMGTGAVTLGGVEVRGGLGEGGEITIDGGVVNLLGFVFSFVSGTGGRIAITATESVTVERSGIFLTSGDGGEITIRGGHVAIGGIGGVAAGSLGTAPSIRIEGTESVLVESGVFSFGGFGAADPVYIAAPDVTIAGGVVASFSTFVPANEKVSIHGEQIRILEGGLVIASSPGTVELDAKQLLIVAGSDSDGVPSRVLQFAEFGAGGLVRVSAPFVLIDGGVIATTSFDRVSTSRFSVDGNPTHISGRQVLLPISTGPAGAIVIEDAQVVSIVAGGLIDSSSISDQPGGSITIDASDRIEVAGPGSGISTRAAGQCVPASACAGGTISLSAQEISIRDGATVSSESQAGLQELGRLLLSDIETLDKSIRVRVPVQATGDAGNIVLDAGDSVVLEEGTISTSSETANGGNISITAGDTILLTDSSISADVTDGQGGNVTTSSVAMILEDGSRIVAQAGPGQGGDITIVTDALFTDSPPATTLPDGSFTDGSNLISASADDPSLSGRVEVQAPDVALVGSLAQLPETPLDASSVMRQRCSARRGGETAGSFTVAGRSGAPPSPDGLLSAALPLRGTL